MDAVVSRSPDHAWHQLGCTNWADDEALVAQCDAMRERLKPDAEKKQYARRGNESSAALPFAAKERSVASGP